MMIVSAKAALTYEYLNFENSTKNMMARRSSLSNNVSFDEESWILYCLFVELQ